MAKNKTKVTKALLQKANKIRLLAMDVDGVLTGGEIIILNSGEEVKIWSVKDRMGFAMLRHAGLDIKLAWITARGCEQVENRAKDLKIDFLYQKTVDKWATLEECARKLGLTKDQVAYIGDDFVDLRALKNAGLSVCPPEAPQVLKNVCDYQSESAGGKGVVREVIELVLKGQGKWQQVMKRFSVFFLMAGLSLTMALSACSAPQMQQSLKENPDQIIHSFTITETSQGLPVWMLESKEARIYNKKQKAVLDELEVEFLKTVSSSKKNATLQQLKDSQSSSAKLTALHGQVELAANDLTVWGNVIVETENGTKLYTEKLKYSTKRGKIYTNSSVKVVRQDSVLLGEGLEATSDLSDIKIFHHEASIQPKELSKPN